ncbi:MAG: regulator SirB [Burkholderiaceae bacterium]|jgi:uncharacterized membrane protein SirB2|nr:regulator SirB [Burkholderiaceae bacterium]
MYEALKWVHVGCVIASGAGFVARGALMLVDSPLLAARFVRIAPHVVDTALLASAIAMAIVAHVSPLAHPWLAAKIVALLAYIALGALALRPGHSRPVRTVAFVAAALVFAYIVGTALNRDPLSWLARAV